MNELLAEQLSRVGLMAGGDPTWDLSPNDCLALGAVLAEVERLRAGVQRTIDYPPEGNDRRDEDGYPIEFAYDEFAYRRIIDAYRDGLKALLRTAASAAGGEQ